MRLYNNKDKELLSIIKSIFQNLEDRYVFFGLGVNAFNRLGPESFIPHYRIISLRDPLENKFIEEDVEIFSLEKNLKSKHINAPRNSNTLMKDLKTQKYIQRFKHKQPVFFVYKPFVSMQKIVRENKWILCANSYKFGKKLFENKIYFRNILQKLNLPVPPGEVIKSPGILVKDFAKLEKKYGLPMVIQHPTRGGGRGTFFINSKKEAKQILPNLEDNTLVLKYIKGPSPSITGCVTPWGIAYTYPQYQVLDQEACYNLKIKTGNGLWCGHDWTFSRDKFDEKTLQKIYNATIDIGEYLKSQGYKGIFGLDFIQDKSTQEFYIGECNPRLLGSFPVLTMIQTKNEEIPIAALHFLSFLKLNPQQHNIMRHIFGDIVAQMKSPKIGAQLILHNKEGRWVKNEKEIKPGIYTLRNNHLIFLREGYLLSHLKSREEFFVSDGVPHKMSPFSPNRRIMRFVTLNQVLKNYKTLTPWAKSATNAIYKELKLKPVRFFALKRFFNPHFMAKG